MRTLILATAAALVLGAPLALANNTTTTTTPALPMKMHMSATKVADQCNALGERFDQAEAEHKESKNFAEAMALRSEGGALCSSSKGAAGIKYLHSALKMIDAKQNI